MKAKRYLQIAANICMIALYATSIFYNIKALREPLLPIEI